MSTKEHCEDDEFPTRSRYKKGRKKMAKRRTKGEEYNNQYLKRKQVAGRTAKAWQGQGKGKGI
jgi:hypothetical protein